jgi:hypothetical protein
MVNRASSSGATSNRKSNNPFNPIAAKTRLRVNGTLGFRMMDALFFGAGIALLVNLALSVWLFFALREDPIARELFYIPNSWLGPMPTSLQLLRFKFSLPWVTSPQSMTQQPFVVRFAFQIARVTGAAFPCLMMGFFVGAFIS